jgi:hypothetical protein
MLLSRTLNASKAAPRSELHTASASLLAARQPQQLTTLTRFVVSPLAYQAARQCGAVVARSYASEGAESPPLGLKEALKSELEYEHDNYEPDEDLPAQPPSPWTLTESPGDSKLTLTRQYNGETVEVTVLADECHDDEGDDEHPMADMAPEDHQDQAIADAMDDSIDVAIVAEARIVKGGRSIDIGFRTDGSFLAVVDVSLGAPEVTDDDESAYAGPKYEELDEQVQVAFDAYLAERGVDAEFGEYLMKLAASKEQREYVGWLQKIHDFL